MADKLTPEEMKAAGLGRLTPAEMQGREYKQPKSMTADDQALGLETGLQERRGALEPGFPGDVIRPVGKESQRLDDIGSIEALKTFAKMAGSQVAGGAGGAIIGRGLSAVTPAARSAVAVDTIGLRGTPLLEAVMETPARTAMSKLLGTLGDNLSHGAVGGALIGQATGHNPIYAAILGAMLKPALGVASRAATPGVMGAAGAVAPSVGQAAGGMMPVSSGPGLLMGLPAAPDFTRNTPTH